MGSFFKSLFGSEKKVKPETVLEQFAVFLKATDIPVTKAPSLEPSNIEMRDRELLESSLAAAVGLSAGHGVTKPPKAECINNMVKVALQERLLENLSTKLPYLVPETRRFACSLWGYLMKIADPQTREMVLLSHVASNADTIMPNLVQCYLKCLTEDSQSSGSSVVISVGTMIRDTLKSAAVSHYMFSSQLLVKVYPLLKNINFDISADAFQTVKEGFLAHKEAVASVVHKNFAAIMGPLCAMVSSSEKDAGKGSKDKDASRDHKEGVRENKDGTREHKDGAREHSMDKTNSQNSETPSGIFRKTEALGDNYALVRQALGLLTSILLERQFMQSMVIFANKESYLISILMLMGGESKAVQYEAFQLFKIFAANPHKTPAITAILFNNRSKIIGILNSVEASRSDDHEFKMDKYSVVGKLESLEAPQSEK